MGAPELDSAPDVTKPLESISNVQRLYYGSYITEPALWVQWETRGRLIAENNCGFLGIDAQRLHHDLLKAASFIKDEQQAYMVPVAYAKIWLQVVKEDADECFNDVQTVHVGLKTALRHTRRASLGLEDSTASGP